MVAGTIGVVANLIVFFALAFVFAAEPSDWVEWYLGGDGWRFLAVTIAIASAMFPRLRGLKLV